MPILHGLDNTLPPLAFSHPSHAAASNGLSGHDLMTMFPTAHHTSASSAASVFGKQEREYLSSRRDEACMPRTSRAAAYASSSSGSSSDSGPSSPASSVQKSPPRASPSAPGPSVHVFSTNAIQSTRGSARSSETPSPPSMTATRASRPSRRSDASLLTEIQAHSIPQGRGDAQFSILRMPLEAFSNPNTSTSQFTEFRATPLKSHTSSSGKGAIDVENVIHSMDPTKRRSGKQTKRAVRA